jgi:two-component system sensor histidine kinase KdpD
VFLGLLGNPKLSLITAVISIFIISTVTKDYYLTLGAACLTVLQFIIALLIEPTIPDRRIDNVIFIMLGTVIFVGLMMHMITSIQQQEYYSTVKADRNIVYQLVINSLLTVRGMGNIYATVLEAISELYGRASIIFTYTEEGQVVSEKCNPPGMIYFDSERQAATEAFLTGCVTGRFSDLCTYSPFIHIPLKTYGEAKVVISILFDDLDKIIDKEMYNEMENLIKQATSAIERQLLADRQQNILLENERERTRADFLRAISHDIRSPLTGIMSACSTLLESGERMPSQDREGLLSNIHEEAEWLCHMVENLLSVTRIDNGLPALKKYPEVVEEVIAEVVSRCNKRFPDFEIRASTPDNMLLVDMDATLIMQVLTNLVENAVKYSGCSKRIDINVKGVDGYAVFSVCDFGVGISPDSLSNLFKPIARKQDYEAARGLGIGLSICRSIICAHGGEISGHNDPERGAIFTFTLPMEDKS